jgi:hypothetical protein
VAENAVTERALCRTWNTPAGLCGRKDPDYPDVERYVVTCWVTVVNTPYA